MAVFERLFPEGLAGPDVLGEIAPQGRMARNAFPGDTSVMLT